MREESLACFMNKFIVIIFLVYEENLSERRVEFFITRVGCNAGNTP